MEFEGAKRPVDVCSAPTGAKRRQRLKVFTLASVFLKGCSVDFDKLFTSEKSSPIKKMLV